MNNSDKSRKAKAGLLLIASPRFRNLGAELSRGTYHARKSADVAKILESLDFLDTEYPGIVYEREDVLRAMDLFFAKKVDFIIAEFLSWSEDFAWIRFLRDMPDIPDHFRQHGSQKKCLSRYTRRKRFYRLSLRRHTRGIVRSLGVGGTPQTAEPAYRNGLPTGGNRADTHVRRGRTCTQYSPQFQHRTAGQLQRSDVVHIHGSLPDIFEDRA